MKKININKLFIYPTVVFLTLLTIFPFIQIIIISLTNYELIYNNNFYEFIGLKNFIDLFKDQLFIISLENTFRIVFFSILFEVSFGIILSMTLYYYFRRIRRMIQTILILPLAMTPVAVALMWKYMFNSTYGIINYSLSLVGISNINWLGSIDYALISIIIVDIWQWTPFVLIICLAGIESIPAEIVDMALIDGANKWQLFTYFILPQIKNFLIAAILLRAIDCFKIFDVVYVLTEGGPGSSTETLSLMGYRLGFSFFKTSLASAESLILLLIIIVLAYAFLKISRKITFSNVF